MISPSVPEGVKLPRTVYTHNAHSALGLSQLHSPIEQKETEDRALQGKVQVPSPEVLRRGKT